MTADLIFRTARALGWDVTYATNITDVGHLTEDDFTDPEGEDRMVKALKSKEVKGDIGEVAKTVIKKLYKDLSFHHPYIIDRIKI